MSIRVSRIALLVAVLATSLAATATERIRIDVRARAVAPGEPVRLVVRSPVPLRTLDGRFLQQDLSFQALEGSGTTTWAAWAVVPLDGDPGPARVEVRGVTAEGDPVDVTQSVTVEPREFPEEHLEVESRYVEPPAEVLARIRREKERVAEIYAARSPLVRPDEPFVRPVPGEPTSVFGLRRFFNGTPRSPHPGLDLRAPAGTPVRSSGPGRVVLAEELYYSGNLVIVDHGGGLVTLYAHLSSIDVAEGQEVSAGEVVGRSGATGRVTGPHLHWGAKIGRVPFDPRALLDPALRVE